MKKIFTYVLIPVIIFLGVIFYGYLDKQFDIKSSYEGAAYIKSFRTASGKINDVSNKIGMNNPDIDFKWFLEDDKTVRIEFGYITMTFPMEEFVTENCKKVMNDIGITWKLQPIDYNGGTKLLMYYNGQEMERWLE